MPILGLAFSGGGITGLLGALCVLNSMNGTYPALFSRSNDILRFSTSSGGTIGTGLYWNAGNKMEFPNYSVDMKYAEANQENTSSSHPYWFANALNYLPSFTHKFEANRSGSFDLPIEPGWWVNVIDAAFYIGYGVHDYDIIPGTIPWYVNFGLLKKKACPISLDSSGIYDDAEDNIHMATMEMVSGDITPKLPSTNVTTLDGMSYSSSFWVASIIENSLEYFVFHDSLPHNSEYYFTDGGLLDTTGIVALLQQKTQSIIAFYNNNDDLTELNSTFAFLFNVTTTTDSQNSLEGPPLGKVFNSEKFDQIIANLTNPSILRAHAVGLEVLENAYFGVEAYTLKNLYIFSNQYSKEFVDSFVDKKIGDALSKDFPNKFSVGMPTLDANVLCMFNQWKLQKYEDEITELINSLRF